MDLNNLLIKNSRELILGNLLIIMVSIISGCTISSGLKSGDLPPTGAFVADNGMQFIVKPLSLATLPTAAKFTASKINDQGLRKLVSATTQADYRITSSDILSIVLVGYPEITPPASSNSSNPYASGFVVDQQGYIQFPLIGRIQAQGLSVPEFAAKLRSKLQKYLKYPDPQVKIINYRGKKFFIDGEVRQPGEFNINDAPVTLFGAISMAGGVNTTGDSNGIELIREGQRYQIGLRALQKMGISANQIHLQDGDSVHVNRQDRNKVYVLGEFGVVEPLEIPEQGLSLAHVLGESRGLNANTADAAKIYVVRDHPSSAYTDIYYVDMQTVTNFALANRFEMQANDIVYVDPTGLVRWSRFIRSILPSASTVNMLSGL